LTAHRFKSFYQPGGALPLDSPAYVLRGADDELFTFLMRGEYCSILTSRQMGKSSLIARTSARLRAEKIATCVIDLSGMSDADVEPEKWYFALVLKIGKALKRSSAEIAQLWSSSEWPTPAQRWTACMEHLLAQNEGADDGFQLVAFLDEIDATRNMAFKDGFFATIRSCYNRRPTDPVFRRLSFCLVGSARPTDLIADPHLTPFNIGRRIELTDFSEEEAQVLIPGMEREEAEGIALLQRVLYWTGGHPYLSHRLCMKISESEAVCTWQDVDRLAEVLFFSTGSREQDDNLAFVSHRVLSSTTSERDVARLLSTYDDLLRGKRVRDQKSDSVIGVLHLAGIVRTQGSLLAVRNRIYARVFDRSWVRENMPGAQLRMVRAAYWRAAVRWSVLTALMGILALYATVQRRIALRDEETAARLAHVEHVILMQSMEALWEHADLSQMEANLRNTPPSERNFEWRYWLRQMNQSVCSLADPKAGGERVASAIFSPNGTWLATSGRFPFIDIWNPRTGALLDRLPEPSCPYTLSLDVSPNGRRLVSGGDGAVARLWDTRSWRPIARLDMGTSSGEVSCVRFSPNGKMVGATMVQGGDSRIFDSATGRLLYKFPARSEFALAFDPVAPRVALAGVFNQIAFWRLDKKSKAPDLVLSALDHKHPHSDFSMDCIAFSKDGRRLAAGSKDNTVRIWDLPEGQLEHTLRESENGVSSLAFTPGDERLLAVGLDRSIRIWDVSSGEQLRVIPAHTRWINSVAVSRDLLVATASDDGTSKIWSVSDPPDEGRLPSEWQWVGKTPASNAKNQLAALTSEGRLGWFDPGTKFWSLMVTPPLSIPVFAFGSTPDGSLLEAIDGRGRVIRWSRDNPTEIVEEANLPSQLAGSLLSIAFSPDGNQALAALKTGEVARVDLWTGTYRLVSAAPYAETSCAAWAPGTKPLWAVGPVGRRTLFVSDPDFSRPPRQLPVESSGGLFVSDNGERVVVTCVTSDRQPDPTVVDLRTLKTLRLVGHATSCQSADFSHDGSRIVTGGADDTVRLWDADAGINLQTWRVGFGAAVTFAPDGNSVVACRDDQMRILSAADSNEVATWTKDWSAAR
jgi:WD40 repeat protein